MNTNDVAIIEQFGQKADGYVQQLAHAAGQTVDHFWPLFVKQQVIEGWCHFGGFAFVVLLALTIYFILTFIHRRGDKTWADNAAERGICGCFRVVAILAIIITLIACVVNFSDNFTKIVNPEYVALQSVIDSVRRY